MKIKYLLSTDPRSADFNQLIQSQFPLLLTNKKPDIILVSGGDGALLHAIQRYNRQHVSFLGRAAGTLNFLMNTFNNDQKTIKALINNDLDLTELVTNTIKVQVERGGQMIDIGQAVNEVVIGSDIMGYHHLSISTQDNSFDDFQLLGGGICVSTDLGSTGYNFNLGGPVLPIGSQLWSLAGIVTNRYLKDIIRSQKITMSCLCSRRPPQIYIDGIVQKYKLKPQDKIILSDGDAIKILFLKHSDFLSKRIEITSRYRKG